MTDPPARKQSQTNAPDSFRPAPWEAFDWQSVSVLLGAIAFMVATIAVDRGLSWSLAVAVTVTSTFLIVATRFAPRTADSRSFTIGILAASAAVLGLTALFMMSRQETKELTSFLVAIVAGALALVGITLKHSYDQRLAKTAEAKRVQAATVTNELVDILMQGPKTRADLLVALRYPAGEVDAAISELRARGEITATSNGYALQSTHSGSPTALELVPRQQQPSADTATARSRSAGSLILLSTVAVVASAVFVGWQADLTAKQLEVDSIATQLDTLSKMRTEALSESIAFREYGETWSDFNACLGHPEPGACIEYEMRAMREILDTAPELGFALRVNLRDNFSHVQARYPGVFKAPLQLDMATREKFIKDNQQLAAFFQKVSNVIDQRRRDDGHDEARHDVRGGVRAPFTRACA